jgi:hypothetical protein
MPNPPSTTNQEKVTNRPRTFRSGSRFPAFVPHGGFCSVKTHFSQRTRTPENHGPVGDAALPKSVKIGAICGLFFSHVPRKPRPRRQHYGSPAGAKPREPHSRPYQRFHFSAFQLSAFSLPPSGKSCPSCQKMMRYAHWVHPSRRDVTIHQALLPLILPLNLKSSLLLTY